MQQHRPCLARFSWDHVQSCILAVALVAWGALLAACGSGNSSATGGGADGGAEGGKGGKVDGSKGSGKHDSGGTMMLHQTDGGGVKCTKTTCEKLGFDCGEQSDGCGGLLNCGTCTAPQTCGGAGKPSQCGGSAGCVPTTCAKKGTNCGPESDGCGGLLDCGSCTSPEQCGANGHPGVCSTPTPAPDASNPCVPTDCSALHIECGPAGDGCGGMLSCGKCSDAETCGGGGTPSVCGSAKACVPTTCAKLGVECGVQADGCGGTLQCGGCDGGTCGAGGPSKCGTPSSGCTPKTCSELGVGCGPSGDGCGGTIVGGCGGCDGGSCGGGGVPDQCGSAPVCVPATSCAAVGVSCGSAGDGCGGVIVCPACPAGTACGAGGTPNVCGMPACTPKTCSNAGPSGTPVQCGVVGDGCGGTLTCNGDGGVGGCTPPETCGGGGVPNTCGGAAACTPKTCAQQGFNCGLADDGCGNVLNCGGGGAGFDAGADAGAGCPAPEVCGGGGVPNVCGPVVACGPLCMAQQTCDGGVTTTLTGTVWAPNGTDPIYDAIVYVPTGTVEPFSTGLSCGCQAVTGDPLVQATTGVDGTFTLSNVPANTSFPLVIQLGPWRRQVVIPAIAPCTTVDSSSFGACNTASAQSGTCLTSFPTVHTQGDIPLMALVTGSVDTLECVFRKIGLQDSEFGDPGGPNRMQLYLGDGTDSYGYSTAGATYDTYTPEEDSLWTTQDAINAYDLVLFACQGTPIPRDSGSGVLGGAPPSTAQSNVINYANLGGRVFATHYNYTWLYDDSPFSTTASWAVDPNDTNTFGCEGYPPNASCGETGNINQSFPRGLALAQWLQNIYPATTLGQIEVNTLRDDFGGGVVAPSLLWMSVDDSNLGTVPLEYTFDTPVGTPSDQQCGRVEYEDYHVEDTENNPSTGKTFPTECDNNPMTPQEKLLEFQLFDLSSCVGAPPTCTPLTCANAGPGGTPLNCGPQSDGCGNILQCGTCTPPESCGGGGTAGVCGGTTCTPSTCGSLGLSCGMAGDGCGGTLSCGSCASGMVCSTSGSSVGTCITPSCTPATCANAGPGGTAVNCGTAPDGCGGVTANCGSCAAGQTCGFGGKSNICGGPSCTPATCTSLGDNCGTVADGCGGTLSCGTCTAPDTCGGGGKANVCGSGGCTPATCTSLGFNCGPAGDGCGGELQCGTCTAPETCGGGGKASVCGGNGCTPTTCTALGFNCGPAGDGCGGELQCGTCPVGQACGAGGQPGVCAPLDAGSCAAQSCSAQNISCGPAGDGCGNEIQCGTCPAGEECGAGGTPGKCGSTGCKPETCVSEGLNCGPAGDGCGGELSCGTCKAPDTCGGGGIAGQCGTAMGAK